MKILIPRKYTRLFNEFIPIEDSMGLTNYELLVYCYLKFLAPCITDESKTYYLHTKTFIYNMFGTTDISDRITNNIIYAIRGLIQKNVINASKQQNSVYCIDTRSLRTDCTEEKYIVIEHKDIKKIVLSDYKCKFQLLRYYLCLLSTVNSSVLVRLDNGTQKSNVVGWQTQKHLSDISALSPSTVIRFNKILEDLKLIYICRSCDFSLIHGELSRIPNVYGRYCDKEYIQKYAYEYSKHNNGYKTVHEKVATSNKQRELALKYRWLCKGKKYPLNEVQEIYNYIIQANKKYKELYETEGNAVYLDKIKDLTVFDSYAITKGAET